MKALFVANIEMDESEGIYKKVNAESNAIAKKLGECKLVTKAGKSVKVKSLDGKSIVIQQSVLKYVNSCIKKGGLDFLYIRHMIPSPQLISLLKLAKKNGIVVYYEIPTYPYFGEQFKASRHKYRAVIKITLDIVFWPFIYKYIDKLVTIRSSSKAKSYKKMYEITNGVRVDNIKSKSYESSDPKVFRMVAVGTLFSYHGYDRVLTGMAQCREKIGDTKIEFHVVGKSQTIDDLQRMADQLNLKNIFFHGMKTTEELNILYEQFNVGLGCLALHRRNADIDTTLKVIEYYCRGVPVISSGTCPLVDTRFTFQIPDAEGPINIEEIYKYYKGLDKKELIELADIAKSQFSWDAIMSKCLSGVEVHNE